jgi:hypothetical protein
LITATIPVLDERLLWMGAWQLPEAYGLTQAESNYVRRYKSNLGYKA